MALVCNNNTRLNRLLAAEKLIGKYVKIMEMPKGERRNTALNNWESEVAIYRRDFMPTPTSVS